MQSQFYNNGNRDKAMNVLLERCEDELKEQSPNADLQKDLEILKGLEPEMLELAKKVAAGDEELSDELYEILFDSEFIADMPYGTQKARDGDPYEWIANKLEQVIEQTEECGDEEGDEEVETEVAVRVEGEGEDEEPEEDGKKVADDEIADEEEDNDEECDEDSQFSEWFNEQMKVNQFDEALFSSVKSFLGAVGAAGSAVKKGAKGAADVASDVAAGVKGGVKAAKSGKGIGDVITIAGTQMKANQFERAYKEMWLGFNKGLKLMNPKLQTEMANNEKVRDSVNTILGNVIEALERGKILQLSQATQKVMPGTNPEQAEAAAEKEGGSEAATPA